MQITEANKYSTKDITQWVRETLRANFPDLKISVRYEGYSGGSSIHVNIMESKTLRFRKLFSEITEEEIFKVRSGRNLTTKEAEEQIKSQLERTHDQLNNYHLDDDYTLTAQGKTILKEILKIGQKYNYDNSDPMTDYFDVNYYFHLGLGKWDKPFKDGTYLKSSNIFKVIVLNGKPEELDANSEEELKEIIKSLYRISKEPNNENLDFKVYNETEEDISESQFIQEMVSEVMEADK